MFQQFIAKFEQHLLTKTWTPTLDITHILGMLAQLAMHLSGPLFTKVTVPEVNLLGRTEDSDASEEEEAVKPEQEECIDVNCEREHSEGKTCFDSTLTSWGRCWCDDECTLLCVICKCPKCQTNYHTNYQFLYKENLKQ
jgi:hypothetical protein